MKKIDYYKTQRKIALENANYRCQICGTKKATQTAHILPRYTYLVKKYGSEILDHHTNLMAVCDLKCNYEAEISTGGEAEKKQVLKITTAIRQGDKK